MLTRTRVWGLAIGLALVTVLCFAIAASKFTDEPLANTGLTHFDTIIVLGCPANKDGSIAPDQRERVMEGVREYRRGIAPHIIVTGGPAHNSIVEARAMDDYARSQGVPAEAIFEEPQARNTIQNAFYSEQIMEKHHWRSAEVVTSLAHIYRAALIFDRFSTHGFSEGRLSGGRFPVSWRVHAAPWPVESSRLRIALMYTVEIIKVSLIRSFGFAPSPFMPPPAH